MRIIGLQVSNFKRIKAVKIVPNGDTVTLVGENGVGKSSILDAIEAALGGARSCPEQPIRTGERKATIKLDLGDLEVERIITHGSSRLEVRSKDGEVVRTPQEVLNKLCSKVAFDPLWFARAKPLEQYETLRSMVPGLDTTDLDAEAKEVYRQRALVNHDLERAKVMATQVFVPPEPEKPERDPVDVSALGALSGRIYEAERIESTLRQREYDVQGLQAQIDTIRADMDKQRQRSLVLHKEMTKDWPQDVTMTSDGLAQAIKSAIVANKAHDDYTTKLQERVRAQEDKQRLQAEAEDLKRTSDLKTQELEAIASKKAEKIASAKLPIPGLSASDGVVTLNGVPFSQASQAERIAASVAIGCELHPQLKVLLVRDAAVCRPDTLDQMKELAAAKGYQLWIELIDPSTPGAVVIEDGQVSDSGPHFWDQDNP